MIINRANPPTAPPMMYGVFDVNSEKLSVSYFIYDQRAYINTFHKTSPDVKEIFYF